MCDTECAPRISLQEGSLHCVTAGYFARVVGTLLFRRTTDIMKYLESHQSVRTLRHATSHSRVSQHLKFEQSASAAFWLVGLSGLFTMHVPPSPCWADLRGYSLASVYEVRTAGLQVLHRLIHHLDTTSIAEIVVRLVGAEEQTGMYLAPTQVQPPAP